MRRGYAEVMQKTGIEKMLFGGEARLLSGRGKKRREGKSARKNKWSAGESGTSGWSGQRARASMMGDVSGQFEGNRSTESSESGSEVGIPRSARRARGKILLCGTCPAAAPLFQGTKGNSAGQSRILQEVYGGTNSSSSTSNQEPAAQLEQSNKLGDGGGMIHGSGSFLRSTGAIDEPLGKLGPWTWTRQHKLGLVRTQRSSGFLCH